MSTPTLGWSNFALGRHKPKTGYSYSTLSNEDVVRLTLDNWEHRVPGQGEVGLDRKVVVPIKNPKGFVSATALLKDLPEDVVLVSKPFRRQDGEDLFIKTLVDGQFVHNEPCNHVKVVCYSAEALLENDGERTTDDDWEIVCIIASPEEVEPMHPLAMARNLLEKPGGTKSEYTAQEFAEAIYYWSQRVSVE